MIKRIKCMLVIAVLLLICTSCGNEGENSLSSEDVGYQWTDTSKPIVKEKGLVKFDIISSKNAMADDYNDMKVFADLYDATNVDVNWVQLSETAYKERKNLIMSDRKTWPDAIYHAGFSDAEIIKFSSRKYILPISDYLEYMPNFSKILSERPDIDSALRSPDGKIYSLPRVEEMGVMPYPNLLFLNKVWVKSLIEQGAVDFLTEADLQDGLELTVDQFEQILILFKENDMNGNGKTDDEFPLNFVYQNWQGNQSDLYAAFGLTENIDHRIIADDRVVFTATDDRFKDATNNLARWIKAGLVDLNIIEQTQDQFLAGGKGTPKYGAFYWWESETVVSQSEDYICLEPLIGYDGTQRIGISNSPEISKGMFVVLGDCKHPEILLTYMDRFFDPFVSAQINYGPIGLVYEEELDENGMLVQKPIPEGMTADELRLKNAPLGVMYLSENEWKTVLNMEPRAKLRLERIEKYAVPFVEENVKPFPSLSFNLEETNKLGTIETNIYDFVYAKQSEWLMNGGVSESEWEEYKAEINEIGLQDFISVYQAAYDRTRN